MSKVRVILSMHPERPVEVDEDELPSLRSQGILVGVEGESAGSTPEGESKTGSEGSGSDDSESASTASTASARKARGSASQ